jgi:uncharacterized membrane protein
MEKDHLLDSDYTSEFGITPDIRAFLIETARWAYFLAIIGFIMIGFIVVIAIFAGSLIGMMASQIPEANGLGAIGGGFITFFYLLIAGIYIFPVLYLYRFSIKMKEALRTDNQESLSISFENLKSHYKFIGILMIVVLGFYALGILMLIIGGITSF